jgi:hypothetical protein
MKTIMLVGHPPRGQVADGLSRAGFFTMPASDAEIALAILNAVRADGFVIDVGNTAAAAAASGERLIEQLDGSERWRDVPIVVTGADPAQCARLSNRGRIVKVIPACERGSEAVVDAVRRAMHPPTTTRLRDAVPERSA